MRFTGVLVSGLVVLGVLAQWFMGPLVVAGAVLLLLLCLGIDARVAGWLVACAALTGVVAVGEHGSTALAWGVATLALLLWALTVLVISLRRAGTLV